MDITDFLETGDYGVLDLSDMGEVLAGVDWMTVTTSTDEIGKRWVNLLHQETIDSEGRRTHLLKKAWNAMGYRGIGIPGVRVGKSNKLGYIAVLSGGVSERLWRKFLPGAKRVTRIDLAVTVRLGMAMENLAGQYYEFVKDIGSDEEEGPDRNYSIIQNNKGGQTLYVGSRRSQQFGRVYDKGVQSGGTPPGFIWRYEVEYKKPLADQVASKLSAVDKRDYTKIISTLHGWFERREVLPLFKKNGEGMQLRTETIITTDDKKLAWLNSSVAPSVAYLISRGRGPDALYALGLISEETKQELDKGEKPDYNFDRIL